MQLVLDGEISRLSCSYDIDGDTPEGVGSPQGDGGRVENAAGGEGGGISGESVRLPCHALVDVLHNCDYTVYVPCFFTYV